MLAEKYFWAAVALLLLILATVGITSAELESETADESEHLAAGYSYWKTGDYKLSPGHPPLGKLLEALPLLPLNPRLPVEHPSWTNDNYEFGKQFLYHNRVPADTMLRAARCVTIALTLLLGLAVAWWTRREFGAGAALLALTLVCFEPNLIAHGRYVTTDMIATLLIFLTCLAWWRYLQTDRRADLIKAGLLLGLALASKFSGPLLAPILLALYAVARWRRFSLRHLVRSFVLPGALAFVVIWATYAFETKTISEARRGAAGSRSVAEKLQRQSAALNFLSERVPIPAVSYWIGTSSLIFLRQMSVYHAYLLGRTSRHGWWYYFPVAFSVKTPAALLALVALSVPFAMRRPELAIPPLLYLLFSMASGINIGIRHLLPIYPFLIVLAVAVVPRRIALALTVLVVIESVHAYPEYLPFFNVLAGGAANGHKYLLDSNLDWGQDIKKLKRYTDEHHTGALCVNGLEAIMLDYYGIAHRPLTPAPLPTDCVAAIGANQLFTNPEFTALRARRQDARVGYSIYIYDLRGADKPVAMAIP